MSRHFRILLAVACVAFAASLFSTATSRADHDDDDCWDDHRRSLRWHNRHHHHGHFYRPGGGWDRLHGSYERHPAYGYYPYSYGHPGYGTYGPGYNYGYPYYGGGYSGYGGPGYYGRSGGVGIFFRSR